MIDSTSKNEISDLWCLEHARYGCHLGFAHSLADIEKAVARGDIPNLCPEPRCDRYLEEGDVVVVHYGKPRVVVTFEELSKGYNGSIPWDERQEWWEYDGENPFMDNPQNS